MVMGGSLPPPEDVPEHGGDDGGGGGVKKDFASSARSHASSGDYGYDDQAFEIVEGMKKKAKSANNAARKAEAESRRLTAEADELRGDADKAEANSRSLQAQLDERDKKKKKFGGGKKTKKLEESAVQAKRDAFEIKKRFMAVQTQAYEAATLAAKKRSAADRLRDEAESAELQMVSAASQKQSQPAPPPPAPAPAPTPVPQQQQHHQPSQQANYGGGYAANGYGQSSPKPDYQSMGPPPAAAAPPNPQPYGGQGMQQQQMMKSPTTSDGAYNNYGQSLTYGGGVDDGGFGGIPSPSANRGEFAPMGAPGNGGDYPGYALPAPGMEATSDPYANPF